jgi:radical SAM protein with 4Fe4S-binding SPASM domain
MVNQNNYRFVFRNHSSQNYSTFFDRETGLFIRKEKTGFQEPFWSESGPELLDISITNYCDKSCRFCYRKSDSNGAFIKISDYTKLVNQASQLGVLQIALGGGNPNYHPQFCEILRITREKYGIVVSYTTNGNLLTNDILNFSKEYCGAIALSAYYDDKTMESIVNKIISYKIKLNIHFLLTSATMNKAIRWLRNPPDFLKKVNAIVFLNYKPLGRDINKNLLLNNSSLIELFFSLISGGNYPFKIGFDSCSISWLVKYLKIDNRFIEPCEAARFSAFIDENLNMYPCSFSQYTSPPNINKDSILNIWQNETIFNSFRRQLNTNQCNNKMCFKNCLGGCPIYPEINSIC